MTFTTLGLNFLVYEIGTYPVRLTLHTNLLRFALLCPFYCTCYTLPGLDWFIWRTVATGYTCTHTCPTFTFPPAGWATPVFCPFPHPLRSLRVRYRVASAFPRLSPFVVVDFAFCPFILPAV